MKTICLLSLFAAAAPAAAATYSATWNSGFTAGTAIPDGTTAGWSDVRSLPIPADHVVTDVTVSISLSGGWNGDLYAYLTHPLTGSAAVLLNRPGRTSGNALGYADGVLNVVFSDAAAAGDIHFYQGVPGSAALIASGGAWQPDGRQVSPLSVTGSEPRTAMLAGFDGMAPASAGWTLFVADLASGDVHTIANWGLTVTTVPEPGTSAALILGGIALTLRRRPSRRAGRA